VAKVVNFVTFTTFATPAGRFGNLGRPGPRMGAAPNTGTKIRKRSHERPPHEPKGRATPHPPPPEALRRAGSPLLDRGGEGEESARPVRGFNARMVSGKSLPWPSPPSNGGENARDFFARTAPCNLLACAVAEAFGAEVTGQGEIPSGGWARVRSLMRCLLRQLAVMVWTSPF